MHGVQGPGGSRWGIAPGRGGSRTFRRDVYVRRRILAVLVVLLLLALLVPRACQALLGSNEAAGPREHQKAGAPEAATGTGGGTKGAGKTATKDTAPERGAPFVKNQARSEDTSGAATTNLTAMVTETTVIGGDETLTAEDAVGESSGAGEGAQGPVGPSLAGAQQTVVEPQNAPAQTSRASAQRPLPEAERAPAHRQVVSSKAKPVTHPARERTRARRDLAAIEPVAVEPVTVEPVAVEPVAVEPVAVEPVVADTGFVAHDTSVGPREVASRFRGNTVGGAVNGRAAFDRVGAARPTRAVLAGGARRTVAGLVRTPRRAGFLR
jgi:hypothetical protein